LGVGSTFRKEEMWVEELLPFIQEVGFPVVVTFYLLHRIESKLDSVIDSIQMLPHSMKAEPPYETKKNIS
jgi:hypothetical protein